MTDALPGPAATGMIAPLRIGKSVIISQLLPRRDIATRHHPNTAADILRFTIRPTGMIDPPRDALAGDPRAAALRPW